MSHEHGEPHYDISFAVPIIRHTTAEEQSKGEPALDFVEVRRAIDVAKSTADANGMIVVQLNNVNQLLPRKDDNDAGAWRIDLHVRDKEGYEIPHWDQYGKAIDPDENF